MADAEIGALRVTLAMNAGEFVRGARQVEDNVDKIRAKFESLSDSLDNWGNVAKAAFAVFVAALPVVATKEAIERIEQLAKSAEKLNMPIEQLSGFKYAAEVSGASLDNMTSALEELRKNMNSVAKGDAEDLDKALKSIGVAVADDEGTLRNTGDVLKDLSDKFANFKDGIEKSDFAVKLFGESGKELLPLLSQGSERIKELTSEAESLGQVADSTTSKSLEKLSENVKIMNLALEGVWNKVAAEVAPALADFAAQIVGFIKEYKLVEVVSNEIIDVIRTLRVDISNIGYAFQMVSVAAHEGMKIAAASFDLLVVAVELAMKNIVNQAAAGMEGLVNAIVSGIAAAAGAIDAVAGTDLGAKITQSMAIDLGRLNTDAASAAYDALAAKIAETNASMNSQISQLANNASTSAEAIMSGWAAHYESAAERIPKATAPIVAAEKEDAEAKKELNKQIAEGVRLAKEMETPRETELRQLAALEAAYKAGKISAEAMGKAQVAAAYTAQNAYASLASNVMSALGKIFENNKAVAIATALVNTYEGVTKALASYPPPLSYVAAAAALAAGLAQVMNIKSTSKTSGGGGGSGGTVGSGVSSGQFEGGGGGASTGNGSLAASPQMLTVRGLTAGQLFSGEQVRELAAQLVKFQKDGGEVVIA